MAKVELRTWWNGRQEDAADDPELDINQTCVLDFTRIHGRYCYRTRSLKVARGWMVIFVSRVGGDDTTGIVGYTLGNFVNVNTFNGGGFPDHIITAVIVKQDAFTWDRNWYEKVQIIGDISDL